MSTTEELVAKMLGTYIMFFSAFWIINKKFFELYQDPLKRQYQRH